MGDFTEDMAAAGAFKAPAKKRTKPKKKTKLKVKKHKMTGPKTKRKVGISQRSERLDMRLTKAEKAKISARAYKTRRTVTSLIIEAIEKIK